jgi:hypothetical protein
MNKQYGFGAVGIIVIVAILALIGFGGWYVWQANQSKSPQSDNGASAVDRNATPQPNQNDFEIPELDVKFEKQGGIMPVYNLRDHTYAGVAHKLVIFTTQQMKDAGAAVTACADFDLLRVAVFDSKADVLQAMQDRGAIESGISRENGFIEINGKFFYVPPRIESHAGVCLDQDSDFENQQRVQLRNSLMTLKVS